MFVVEQREDALPTGFGGGSEPAEVANALQTFGQNMLQKAAQELGRAESEGVPLLIVAIFIFETDVAVVGAQNAL